MNGSPYAFGTAEKTVKISAHQHESGVIVIDVEAGSSADIDIDIDGSTINIIRDGQPKWS
jgi:hypothetical protein